MTIEEMKQRKKELGYTCARLSELSGVPLSTVQKIFSGATPSPRYGTLLSLESLLAPDSAQDTAAHSGRAIPQVSTDAAYRTMPPRLLPAKHPHPQLHRPPPVTISLHRITHSPPKS